MRSVKMTRSWLLAVIVPMSGPAFTQLDLSGEIFNLRFHEEGWEEEIGDI